MVTGRRSRSYVQSMLWASGCVYIWLGLAHVYERPTHLLGTYARLPCEHATGCSGVLGAGNLWGDSYSEGASCSPNRMCKGAMFTLRQFEGLLDATEPSEVGASPGVTVPARPCAGLMGLGMLLKQQDSTDEL